MTTKLLFSALAGLIMIPAFSAVPFQKGKTQPRLRQLPKAVMTKASEQRLLSEDFSKFTGGSEDIPGNEISYVDEYHIPDSLTAQEGWTGGGIFPCDGSIALMDRKGLDQLGFISTPPFDLAGTATLSFRARILPGSEKGNLWVALCDDYYGPGDDSFDLVLTPNGKITLLWPPTDLSKNRLISNSRLKTDMCRSTTSLSTSNATASLRRMQCAPSTTPPLNSLHAGKTPVLGLSALCDLQGEARGNRDRIHNRIFR